MRSSPHLDDRESKQTVNAARIRSLLFVPGDSPGKLAKAVDVPADALILDWEDAVADTNKTSARAMTRRAMAAFAASDAWVLIRVNSTVPDLFGGDCAAIRKCMPNGVVIPKCESASDVESLLPELPEGAVVLPLIESPLGVLNAARIASSSSRIAALLFGAEDYSVEAGIMRSPGEPELAFARSSVVNAARAMGKEVFDSPLMQYRDLDAVRRAAWRSRRLGFSGQAAIHPHQIAVINEVFSPSWAEIDKAKAVVARFKDHGGGVYGVDGALEDQPIVRAALKILERVR